MIWSGNSARINAVGITKRTLDKKEMWQNLRCRTKEKLYYNKSSANKTGRGPAKEIALTNAEQQVHSRTLTLTQVAT